MKVVTHTSDLLVLRPAREGTWLALGGALVLVVGIVLGTWLSTKTVLTCTRVEQDQIDCTVSRELLGWAAWSRSVTGVRGARVDQRVDEDSDLLYRAVLLTSEEAVPLSLAWSSGRASKQHLVDEVNAYVRSNTRTELRSETGEPAALIVVLATVPLGLIVGLIGLYVLRTTWILDRSRQVLVRQVAGLRGMRVIEYDLGDVVDVHVARSSGDDGDTYRVVIGLSSGEAVPMTAFFSSGYRSKAQTVALMRDFLGLEEPPADEV